MGKTRWRGYLRQNTGLDRDSTIQQEMEKPFAQALELAASLRRMELAGEALTQEYQQATARFEALDGYQVQVKIDTVLTGMGFAGYDRNTIIATMSGGEKTRLALAKLLLERPTLLMLDEPTRGIDIGTKAEIQKLVVQLAEQGMAVIFISSEIDEMLRCCDRMVVLRDKKKVAELNGQEISEAAIMHYIAGGAENEPA